MMVRILALLVVGLTLVTIALGTYVRTTDAGLGCPSWPGCFAKPISENDLIRLPRFAGGQAVDIAKVRLDITTHRYFAGVVGVSILILSALVWTLPANRMRATFWAMASLTMVILQTGLGLWTLEYGLPPAAVTGHLLLGFSILVALYLLYLAAGSADRPRLVARPDLGIRWLAGIGLLALVSQLILGGWTSTHYAGLACPDFPGCLGQAWPDVDYARGFALATPTGATEVGDLLPLGARAAIHWTHRISGMATYLLLTLLAILIAADPGCEPLRRSAILMSLLVVAAAGFGIASVLLRLPAALAVAHTLAAGLLLLNVVYVNRCLWKATGPPPREDDE